MPRIDTIKIRDVVSIVEIRRGLKWLQPDAAHAKPGKVVEPPGQAFEVADTVTVRIHKGSDVEAVNDGVLVPEVVDHVELKVIAEQSSSAYSSRLACVL